MKQYDELIQIAKKYACNKRGKDTILYNPIFRIENNNLYLQYLVVDFNDEENDDYRIKSPTEWLLQNLDNGDVIGYYSVLEKPYTTEDLPDTFTNNGKSIIYDEYNEIIKSFQSWRKKMVEDLTININNQQNLLYQSKVLKIDDEIISPIDFVLANIDDSLDQMMQILSENLGNTISEAFKNYTISLFDKIRSDYIKDKTINYDFIKKYMNVVKYAWPESYELINKSCNIKDVIDYDFDEYIKKMLDDKSIIKQIDKRLKEIDENYQPSSYEKNDKKDYSNVTIHDLIENIDEKLKELDD